jgi:two-component sensor histidine kinase
VWSFLPIEIADKLNESSDWRQRTTAIEEVESLLTKEIENPNPDFADYITDICKKMLKMITDINFKISLTSLRII